MALTFLRLPTKLPAKESKIEQNKWKNENKKEANLAQYTHTHTNNISIVTAMWEGDLNLSSPHKGEQILLLSNIAIGLARSF